MATVGIVTPCYNAETYIERTIESVKSQTFADWEYVIVDDGSTDDSVTSIRRCIAGEERARLIQQPNMGVARTRHNGVNHLSSEVQFLVFLDADDLLQEEFLEVMVTYMNNHPGVSLSYCGYQIIDEHDRLLPDQKPDDFSSRFVARGLLPQRIPLEQAETPLDAVASYFNALPSCCIVRRAVYGHIAHWRQVGICEDKDFVLQLAIHAPVHFVPRHMMLYRRHPAGRSYSGMYASLRELHRMWWNDCALTAEQQLRIRRALVFDRQVAALMATEAALGAWRGNDSRGGLRHAAVAARRLLMVGVAGVTLLVQTFYAAMRGRQDSLTISSG